MGRTRTWFVVVAAALLSGACSSDARDGAPPTTAGEQVTATSGRPEASAATSSVPTTEATAPVADPTSPLRFVEARRETRPLPAGARELAYRGFVGSSHDDPRFIELSLLEFDDSADASAAMASVRESDLAVDLGGEEAAFAFLPDASTPDRTPREVSDLATLGPDPDRVFYLRLSEHLLVGGAARSIHQNDIEALLTSLGGDELIDPETLPSSMRQVVDEALPPGIAVHLRSPDGDVVVTVFDDVSGGWFDYATHGAQAPLADGLDESSVATRLSYQPPSSFGFSGQPIEAQGLTALVGPNLITVEYPPAMAQSTVLQILERAVGSTGLELASSFSDGEVALVDAGGDQRDEAGVEQPRADPPDAARVAELQRFAEEERGLRAAGPADFEFLTDFPADVPPAFFVSGDMWSLAVLLGLVDPDQHDPTSAGEARVERLRGVPGAVVLQPSVAFTEAIVVHEIVHILEDAGGASAAVHEVVDAVQALSEGSAQRVMLAWVATLDDETASGFGEFPWIFPPEGDPRLSPAMQDLVEFAYDEGADFAVALHAAGGNAALDAAFADPPTTSEHILFPESYLRGDDAAVVDAPVVPTGADEVSSGSLGAFVLSLALRAGGETTESELELVRPWSGDAYVVYELDGQRCLDALIVMDDPAAAAALASALGGGDRKVGAGGAEVALTVCRSLV